MSTRDPSIDPTTWKSNKAGNSSTMCWEDILLSVSAWTASKIPMWPDSVSKSVSITNFSSHIQSSSKSQVSSSLNSKSQSWSPKVKPHPWLDFLSMNPSSNPRNKSRTNRSLNSSTCPWKRRSKRKSRRKSSNKKGKKPKKSKQKRRKLESRE